MKIPIRKIALTIAMILMATYLISCARYDAQAAASLGEKKDNHQRLVAADSETQNWLLHGRTYSEQRFSPLKHINQQNVSELGLAWYADTGTNRGLEATPLVVDGVMYATGSWSIVYALDAKTGKMLWQYDPDVPKQWGKYACCDVVNRGVAFWNNKIYVGTIDGRLVALDAADGSVLWDVNTIDRTKPYTITGAPRVVKGKIIIGNGGADLGVRGYFSAYDADSGDMIWRFYTVPGDPAKPFEHKELEAAAKTWSGGKWWEIGGGGTVWDSMAYDPELDLLYVGTGNGAPWSRHLRSPGGGDNLFLSSILAVRPETGQLVWHYQTTPGDSWDYTATQHIILADMDIDGQVRKVLMQAPKNGFFYVLDRETGELVSAEKYVNVTWASHVDLTTGRPIESPDAQWKDKTAVVYPSSLGGHNWHPMAYSPETGLVYIPARDVPGAYGPEPGFKHRPGSWNTGTDLAHFSDVPPEAVTGYLLAWDPVAQKQAWRIKQSGGWHGGLLATAGDLVFQGTNDGLFSAYRADNGQKLWQVKVGTGIIAPPITYKVDGEQYVSIMAGWGGVYGLAFGRAAKAAQGAGPGRILTFKLGSKGSVSSAPLTRVQTLPQPIAPLAVSKETVEQGKLLYQRNCATCHGFGMVGAGVLPDLRYSTKAIHEIWNDIVLGGVLAGNGMASFADALNEKEAQAIRAYVVQRTNEGEIPGSSRPTKKEQ
jgi:quinohemoprotein ethanol dehydrogenase